MYKIFEDFDKFLDNIMNYDIAWIISDYTFVGNSQRYLNVMAKFMRSKKSLLIWGENEPFCLHANIILKSFFNGMELIGSYLGGNFIFKGNKANSG